mgnify:FL=1
MVKKTKADAELTRQHLLDTAELLFLERGVSRTSLQDIATAAGTTRGAIYWHFKDKVDLFAAMLERVTLPLEQSHREDGVELGGDPVLQLRTMLHDALHAVVHDERARRVFEIALYKVEYAQELLAVRDRHVGVCDGFRRKLEVALLAAARAQGVALVVPCEVAALGLWALFDGLLQGWILRQRDFDLLAVGHVTIDVYLRGLGFEWVNRGSLGACGVP